MNALVRIAPRRAEIHATRRAVLRWGIPIVLISSLVGTTLLSIAAHEVTRVRDRARNHTSYVSRPPHHHQPSRRHRTYTAIARAMYDSFPHWLARNPGGWCPSSVRELKRASLPVPSAALVSNLDAWGQPMELRCRITPAGHTIQLRSPGADGMFDTPDDVFISR